MDKMCFSYNEGNQSLRLDVWVLTQMNEFNEYTRSYIQKLIENQDIKVNGRGEKTGYRLKNGDEITVFIPEAELLAISPQNISLDVIYEDKDIIIINKGKGMVVHPAAGNPDGTLVNALLYHCKGELSDINGIIRPGIVHRIDKDTTGLLCVAKNNAAHLALTSQLKAHSMKRTYIALVEKAFTEERGIVDAPIGRHPVDRKKMAVNLENGKVAVTHFRAWKRFSKYTLLELSLETGRTHQIRVHMAYIGHPVCGDELYGRKFPMSKDSNGQLLHAFKLELVHPSTGEKMEFCAPIPDYMKDVIEELEKQQ